jgi:hypothetical protein
VVGFFLQYVHNLQKKYSLGSFDLLGHTAPVQAASLIIAGPFVDYWLSDLRVDHYAYTYTAVVSTNNCFFSILGVHSLKIPFCLQTINSAFSSLLHLDILVT